MNRSNTSKTHSTSPVQVVFLLLILSPSWATNTAYCRATAEKNNLIQSHERTDRRYLISPLRHCNRQQLADWFLKSKLQQQRQLTETLSLSIHRRRRSLPSKPAALTTRTLLTSQKGEPQDVRFRRQAASPPCWVRSEGSMQSNPSASPPAEHAVPQPRPAPALSGWILPRQSRTL